MVIFFDFFKTNIATLIYVKIDGIQDLTTKYFNKRRIFMNALAGFIIIFPFWTLSRKQCRYVDSKSSVSRCNRKATCIAPVLQSNSQHELHMKLHIPVRWSHLARNSIQLPHDTLGIVLDIKFLIIEMNFLG